MEDEGGCPEFTFGNGSGGVDEFDGSGEGLGVDGVERLVGGGNKAKSKADSVMCNWGSL